MDAHTYIHKYIGILDDNGNYHVFKYYQTIMVLANH